MKWMIISAPVLCSAAIALASAAGADTPDADFLGGSDNALIVGPTGIADPGAGYISDTLSVYLDPAGFGGTAADVHVVDYPANADVGPSVEQGYNALTADVLAYFGCTDVCTSTEIADTLATKGPLTLDGYSQGASVISGDEAILAKDGVTPNAVDILLVGDTSSTQPAGLVSGFGPGFLDQWPEQELNMDILDLLGWGADPPTGSTDLATDLTPNNYFPTEVFVIQGDVYGDYGVDGDDAASDGGIIHDAYNGLLQSEIDKATDVAVNSSGTGVVDNDIPTATGAQLFTDGISTIYSDIPALPGAQLIDALLAAVNSL